MSSLAASATFEQAEEILRPAVPTWSLPRGSPGRPGLVPQDALGRGDEVRRCVYTNYCEGLDQKHKQVTCQLWDRLDLEAEGVDLATDGRRRLTAPSWDESSVAR